MITQYGELPLGSYVIYNEGNAFYWDYWEWGWKGSFGKRDKYYITTKNKVNNNDNTLIIWDEIEESYIHIASELKDVPKYMIYFSWVFDDIHDIGNLYNEFVDSLLKLFENGKIISKVKK